MSHRNVTIKLTPAEFKALLDLTIDYENAVVDTWKKRKVNNFFNMCAALDNAELTDAAVKELDF